jgi:hypothetical protein
MAAKRIDVVFIRKSTAGQDEQNERYWDAQVVKLI